MNRYYLCITLLACFALPHAARSEGTLVVCDSDTQPVTLDPQRAFNEKTHTILQQIFDGLVRFDADGRVQPALAASWTLIEPTRLRFTLRRGVRFHNGEGFDSEAVAFSINRYLSDETRSPARSFLEHITAVEPVDTHIVDIVTAFPDGLLLNRLAGFVLIVPPGYLREHGPEALVTHPVGTGAFRFIEWEQERAIHLGANADYWMEGRPRVDQLVFRFMSREEQVEGLIRGEVDIVTELPETLMRRVQESPDASIVKHRAFWTIGATLNNSPGSPLADERVRKALNFAIDRADLIRYDARGNGSVLATLTMPGQGGHNPDLEPYITDPRFAAKLLDNAGVKRPLRLRAHVRTQSERAAKILATQLKRIGVELEFEVFNDAEAIQTLRDPNQRWDLGIAGVPDPMCHSYFVQSIMLSSQSPFSLLKDPEFDRRLGEMVSTVEDSAREKLARELDRYVHDKSLSLFTYQKVKTYGIRKGVEFEPAVSGMPYFFDTTSDRIE